ncbi:MAG: peptidase T [Alphaproteobacteria bacterium]|nr:peptidase T [Alphaproteobacteria bacterium]
MGMSGDDAALAERLIARFFRYLAVTSQSDFAGTTVPSTEWQWDMIRLLEQELRGFGPTEIHVDPHACLTVRVPGNVPGAPRLGFCAHVDTVDVGLSPHIKPQRVQFTGADFCLNQEQDIWFRVADHPEVLPYIGQELLVSDGTSVLGADDKSAVTILMDILGELAKGGRRHGDIVVAFVPDEEIGLRGAKVMDLSYFPVDFAFTIDSTELGEFVYETFNAANAVITITGVPAHPIAAKGVMVNPVLVAADLVSRFDPLDTPENSEGREGYCYVNSMASNANTATVKVSLRDFESGGLAARKARVEQIVAEVQAAHPRAKVEAAIEDGYRNIADSLGNDRSCVELLERGFAAEGITPKVIALRGGTDGAMLSMRGIPTPNYFTGGLNFHSRYEFLPVPAFLVTYRLTDTICRLAAG